MGGDGSGFFAALDKVVDPALDRRLDELPIDLNRFGYDRWGVSPRVIKRALTVVGWLYRHYFRVQTEGLDHIGPGPGLLVGNHSSQMAYDGMLVWAAVALHADPPRLVRAMIERFFATTPLLNIAMTRVGQLTGIPQHAERLLREEGALVLVFPEGHRGGGKVFRDRYKIMGFSQGFMRMALRTGAPIIPFGFIGGEEMCPSFSRLRPIAKLLGAPYVPLTPTVVPVPLPVKTRITFGEPMKFPGNGSEADEVVAGYVAQVEQAVGALVRHGLDQRKGIFW